MIDPIIRFSLQNRVFILLLSLLLVVGMELLVLRRDE